MNSFCIIKFSVDRIIHNFVGTYSDSQHTNEEHESLHSALFEYLKYVLLYSDTGGSLLYTKMRQYRDCEFISKRSRKRDLIEHMLIYAKVS